MMGLTDIGANMLDHMYEGKYHGSKKHAPDVDEVLQRSVDHGVANIFITSGTLQDSREAIKFIRDRASCSARLFTTAGIHPTQSSGIKTLHDAEKGTENREKHFKEMLELIEQSKEIIAVGECGLDADRTQFATMEEQRLIFPYHLNVAEASGLPLFLHDRNCGSELFDLIKNNVDRLPGGGVCHSFTGSLDEAHQWLSLPPVWMIGINGCSLKTVENCEVVKHIPLDRLLLETDAPWCSINTTHHSFSHYLSKQPTDTRFRYCAKEKFDANKSSELKQPKEGVLLVKGRNEPCTLIRVAEAIAAIKNVSVEEVCEAAKRNTQRLFFDNAAVRNRLKC